MEGRGKALISNLKARKIKKELHVLLTKAERDEEVLKVLRLLEASTHHTTVLALNVAEGIELVAKADIVSLTVQQNELTIATMNHHYRTKGPLYRFVTQLDETIFVQISKSTVVNLKKISRLTYSFSGNMLAIMVDGQELSVSRRYLPALKKKIGL